MTRIEVCCVQDRAEAELAVRHGASALGLVSEMPSGRGVTGVDVRSGLRIFFRGERPRFSSPGWRIRLMSGRSSASATRRPRATLLRPRPGERTR